MDLAGLVLLSGMLDAFITVLVTSSSSSKGSFVTAEVASAPFARMLVQPPPELDRSVDLIFSVTHPRQSKMCEFSFYFI